MVRLGLGFNVVTQPSDLAHVEYLRFHGLVDEARPQVERKPEEIPVPMVGKGLRLSCLIVMPMNDVFVTLSRTSVIARLHFQRIRAHERLDGSPELRCVQRRDVHLPCLFANMISDLVHLLRHSPVPGRRRLAVDCLSEATNEIHGLRDRSLLHHVVHEIRYRSPLLLALLFFVHRVVGSRAIQVVDDNHGYVKWKSSLPIRALLHDSVP